MEQVMTTINVSAVYPEIILASFSLVILLLQSFYKIQPRGFGCNNGYQWFEFNNLAGQKIDVPASHQGENLVEIPALAHHVQGTCADGTRGAEQGELAHQSMTLNDNLVATGWRKV